MPIVNMDYKKAKLNMEVTNQVEQSYRANACRKEPWTIEFIESIPKESVFWDLGANTGPYTLIAIQNELVVVAVEPGFNNYAALCRNLAYNNMLDKCIALNMALSEKAGFNWFRLSKETFSRTD